MADLLLELFSEEIPARMQAQAALDLVRLLGAALTQAGITATYVTYVTPRRLAVIAKGLPVMQADSSNERKGPKTTAPEAAIQGFLKSTGLALDQLEIRGDVYFACIQQKGRATSELLKEVIEKTLREFPWPKSMHWGAGDAIWVRPLHSILCLFDGAVVPVQFGAITASNSTRGHRFLAPASLTITQPDAYEDTLKKAHVIADRELRKAMIHQAVTALAQQHGLVWREDMGLLEEVTGLVEWPVALSGRIDAKFMDLPPEVLVSEMRAHQKYFALTDASGTLADRFILIANMQPTDNGAAIVAGNERVLRARLSDGRFFWDQDRKKTLQAWGEGLASVTFHAKLGSIADKVSRINALAAKLAAYIPGTDAGLVARAAALCKADLVTGMVGEFPDLQGVMGRYYALAQQEPAPVADAIRDHYKPLGPTDAVPSAPVSVCIALADKLDTLISMFAIGEKPTGSKDPFALRRAALGVIRMVLENKLCMPLKAIGLNDELLAFFYDRLKVQLKDQGIRHDVINAVVAKGDDDLLRIVARAQALQQFLASDDGANLLIAYKRASNILAIEEKKDKATYAAFALSEFDTLHLEAREEIALKNHMSQLHADLKNPLEKEDYNTAMQLLARLRHPVDVFFDKVMVNAEDKSLRQHRLRMLASIRGSMDNIANFALIEG